MQRKAREGGSNRQLIARQQAAAQALKSSCCGRDCRHIEGKGIYKSRENHRRKEHRLRKAAANGGTWEEEHVLHMKEGIGTSQAGTKAQAGLLQGETNRLPVCN